MPFTGKILLVDDEPHIRKYLGLIARGLGAPTIIEAGNGVEALALYQQESPELVLLDVNMPGMDGLEILAAILAQDPDALVVMLTSLVNRQTVEQCLQLGATSYIRKDTPKEAILAELSEVISANLTED
jgi:two-component system, chemotaxis family, chemotaxis protein CheY